MSEVDGQFYVFGEWPKAPEIPVGDPAGESAAGESSQHWHFVDSSISSAGLEVACRIVWTQLASEYPMYRSITPTDFCNVTRAFQNLESYAAGLGRGDDQTDKLTRAEQQVEHVIATGTKYPVPYKLLAFIRLQEKPEEKLSEEKANEILGLISRYQAYLELFGRPRDPQAQELVAAVGSRLETKVTVASAEARASNVASTAVETDVPRPGASLSPNEPSVGSLCCVLVGPGGKRFLVTADYLFNNSEPGAAVLSPAVVDGGQRAGRALPRTLGDRDRV